MADLTILEALGLVPMVGNNTEGVYGRSVGPDYSGTLTLPSTMTMNRAKPDVIADGSWLSPKGAVYPPNWWEEGKTWESDNSILGTFGFKEPFLDARKDPTDGKPFAERIVDWPESKNIIDLRDLPSAMDQLKVMLIRGRK